MKDEKKGINPANQEADGRFKKGNMVRFGQTNSNRNRSHIALRESMRSFLEKITAEEIAEYFNNVPDENKFQVYATMVDMNQKWSNAETKIDLEALKIELQYKTDSKDDNIIDVSFTEDSE